MPDLTPEEQQRINGYWGLGDSAGGVGSPAPPPPMAAVDSGGGVAPSPPAPVDPTAPWGPLAPPAPPDGVQVPFAPPPEPIPPNASFAPSPPIGTPGVDMSGPAPVDAGGGIPGVNMSPARNPISVEREHPKVSSYWGGAKANSDPYGIGAAQKGELAAMGDRSDALRRAADASAVKAVQVAEGQRDLGRMQEEDAAISRAEAELTQRHFNEGMQEIGRQLDDVKAKKVDPLRMMKEQPALGVLAVIGGALSGFYQGMTGGQTNEFLTNLDRQLDRGIAEDERQIREHKFAIGEAGNLLSQQRETQKDHDLAKLQTKNLQYEAVKQEIAAEAMRDEIPVDKARADEMIAQVTLAQQQLAEEIGRRKLAQAQAAGAASYAQAKEVREFRYKVYEKMIGEGFSPAQAEEESRRQVAVQYLGHVGPRPAGSDASQPSMTREQRGKLAVEHSEAQRSTDEFNAQVDAMRKHPAILGSGIETSALAHLPQRVAPESNKYDQDLNEINTRILQAMGKVAKDADGKPNKVMLEKLEQRFEIHQGDSTPMKLQKLEGARHVYNALAREQGASSTPEPDARNNLDLKPVK